MKTRRQSRRHGPKNPGVTVAAVNPLGGADQMAKLQQGARVIAGQDGPCQGMARRRGVARPAAGGGGFDDTAQNTTKIVTGGAGQDHLLAGEAIDRAVHGAAPFSFHSCDGMTPSTEAVLFSTKTCVCRICLHGRPVALQRSLAPTESRPCPSPLFFRPPVPTGPRSPPTRHPSMAPAWPPPWLSPKRMTHRWTEISAWPWPPGISPSRHRSTRLSAR